MRQITYSTLFGNILPTAEEAKMARDDAYFLLRKEGKKVTRSVLRGQVKKYAGLGIPDGRVCDCYELTVWN